MNRSGNKAAPPRQPAAVATPPRREASSGTVSARIDLFGPPTPVGAAPVPPPFPEAGTTFAGFHLLTVLGRGTFGRVYLAKQGELADRLVALKISTEVISESRKLAQLQHQNIVPVYSIHNAGALQAICMPYYGSTTLADVVKDIEGRDSLPGSGKGLISTLQNRKSQTLAEMEKSDRDALAAGPAADDAAAEEAGPHLRHVEGLTYVEAVLWLGSCLADGLAHAHAQGILHRDLKPANVLLTDDGRPMILDFNLAETLREPSADGAGGTVAYMSPEHLAAFARLPGPPGTDGNARRPDGRADLFSLGVILFELLSGRSPYPRRSGGAEALAQALADRRAGAPSVRALNPGVTPAVESILRKLLAPRPEDRYACAADLREDLECQRSNRALRHAPDTSIPERLTKWARRNPRLSSALTSWAFAAVLLSLIGATLLGVSHQLRAARAVERFAEFEAPAESARMLLLLQSGKSDELREGVILAREALGIYQVLPGQSARPGDWRERAAVTMLDAPRRDALVRRVAILLLLLADNTENGEVARDLLDRAAACFAPAVPPRQLLRDRATLLARAGKIDDAARDLGALADAGGEPEDRADPVDYAAALTRGGKSDTAVELLEEYLRAKPGDAAGHYLLAHLYLSSGGDDQQTEDALHHFTACVALRPNFAFAHYACGLCRQRLEDHKRAVSDFSAALARRGDLAPALVQRAVSRAHLELTEAAKADLDAAKKLGDDSVSTAILHLRAVLRSKLHDEKGAAAELENFFKVRPRDAWGFRYRAHVRAARGEAKEALEDLREAIRLDPYDADTFYNYGIVLGHDRKNPGASMDAFDRALRLRPDHLAARRAKACMLAKLGKRDEAVAAAAPLVRATETDPEAAYHAACVYANTGGPKDFDTAFACLKAARRGENDRDVRARLVRLGADQDLAPLRNDGRWQRFREGAGIPAETN